LGLLRPFGRFLEIGKRDILENAQLGLLPFRNNLSLHAIDLGQLIAARDPLIKQMLGELMEAMESKRFKAGPLLKMPREEAGKGFQRLTSPHHIGKVVLEVRESAGRFEGDQNRNRASQPGLSWSLPLRQALDIFQELLQRADLPRHVVVSSRPLGAASDGRGAPVVGHKSSAEIERKSSEVYRAPTGPLEERMAEIWQGLLSVAAVGVDDDFFELGGDSISAIQILSRIRRDFQVGLPPSAVLENSTVAQLSNIVGQRRDKTDEVKA
jgi:acyl carrier protein